MEKIIEIGTVSTRGQIAIPAEVRRRLALADGERVLFTVEGDTLLVKKFNKTKTWEEITKPLRESIVKSDLKESDVVDLVHRVRKSRKK